VERPAAPGSVDVTNVTALVHGAKAVYTEAIIQFI
jgi:hypothetical protein